MPTRSLFNGSLDIMDHERDYATLDKSIRSPIGPVVPGKHNFYCSSSAFLLYTYFKIYFTFVPLLALSVFLYVFYGSQGID